ncbi:hypothetical protein [Kribbella pratensis]|uniref:Uncharacterized protein n=1 Tax=Kribbella pratensis TaxID=2512112 RepID=A0A4R8C4V2_9ACTN|nr:hypothetical protein [Kribbella pratensis]TDW70584.1 hypothetical protein EV653_4633 [Kribbella pratensis]
MSTLDTKPIGVILAVVFTLVLATILTQPFEFVAIRLLEGYWGTSWLGAGLAAVGIQRHQMRKGRLIRLGGKLDARALEKCLPHIHQTFINEPLLATAIERKIRAIDDAAIDADTRRRAADYIKAQAWMEVAPARLFHRITAVDDAVQRFPDDDRMMPTRLGLVLRSMEDRLGAGQAGADLRGFVIRNLSSIDSATLAEHDQYRSRLDMYASLCLITSALSAVNLAILRSEVEVSSLVLITAAMLVLSWACYRGAVMTAEGYATVLTGIDKQINDPVAHP